MPASVTISRFRRRALDGNASWYACEFPIFRGTTKSVSAAHLDGPSQKMRGGSSANKRRSIQWWRREQKLLTGRRKEKKRKLIIRLSEGRASTRRKRKGERGQVPIHFSFHAAIQLCRIRSIRTVKHLISDIFCPCQQPATTQICMAGMANRNSLGY